jgi:hypothetical protein
MTPTWASSRPSYGVSPAWQLPLLSKMTVRVTDAGWSAPLTPMRSQCVNAWLIEPLTPPQLAPTVNVRDEQCCVRPDAGSSATTWAEVVERNPIRALSTKSLQLLVVATSARAARSTPQ